MTVNPVQTTFPVLLAALLASLMLTIASNAHAEAIAVGEQRLVLSSRADMLIVENSDINAETVIQKYLNQQAQWKPYDEYYEVDVTRFRNIWIKTTISNPYPVNMELFVVAAEPGMVNGQFLLIRENDMTESWNLGSHKVFHERPVNHPYYLIPFTLEPGEQTTLLVGMNGIGYADRIWIEQQHRFWSSYHLTSLSDGLFLGTMAILSVMTLMLYIANRDRLFLYFSLMIYGSLAYNLARTGYGFQLLWPNTPDVTARIMMVSVCLPMVGAILFSIRFLQLRAKIRPWLFRFSMAFLTLSIFTTVVALLTSLRTSYSLVFITSTTIVLYFVVIWIHAAYRAVHGDQRAQFYTAAWFLYLLPYIASSIYNLTRSDSAVVAFFDHRNGEVFLAIALVIALMFEVRKSENEKQLAIADAEAKTKFLANMSHEIRTPLNGVIGTAELLGQTEQTPIQSQYSNIIISSGKVLLTLINDILDLTKISGGKLAIEEKPFSFDLILSECSSTFIPMMLQKNIPLYSSIDPNTTLCLIGDEYRLRQVLFNLLSNAMKFTEQGQVTIAAFTEPTSDADKVILTVTVSDTGIGVEQQQLDKIFDQFTQADASTTRRFGGSGLGLAICKSIVEQMGGSVSATSSQGEGSSFSISIPIKVNLPLEQARLTAVKALQGKKLLALIDYPRTMTIYSQHFSHWGMIVDTVESPEQVNEILSKEHQYDGLMALLVTEPINALAKLENRSIPLLLLHHGVLGDIHSNWEGKIKTLPVPAPLQGVCKKLLALFGHPYLLGDKKAVVAKKTGNRSLPLLIVEDNPTNQTVVKRMLQTMGFDPDIANNGLEAVDMTEHKEYGMILMDCEMPLMDGFSASREILARTDKNPPLIVALTAHAMEDTEQRCQDAGMSHVLTKPISMNRLEELLEKQGLMRD